MKYLLRLTDYLGMTEFHYSMEIFLKDENMAWAKPTLYNEEFLTSSRNYANCGNSALQMFRIEL